MPAATRPCPPRRFPTDLTDAQWCLLAPLLPLPRADQCDLVRAMDRLPVAGPARLLPPLAHRPPPLRPLGRRRHPGTAARGAARSGTRGRRPRAVGPLKSTASNAILTLPPFAVQALRRHRRQQHRLRLDLGQPTTVGLRWVEPGQPPP